MNTDIRIAVSFLGHRKRKRLRMLLGAGSTDCLLDLWISTAMNHPSGVLSGMDEIDIALEAGWDGDAQKFVDAMLQSGFLERMDDGTYRLHDWEEHQDVLRLKKIANGWEPGSRIEDIPMSAWKRLRVKIFSRDNYTCQYCGRKTENPHCDHVVPISRGGKSTQDNLTTACPSCNLSKGAKMLSEWRQ